MNLVRATVDPADGVHPNVIAALVDEHPENQPVDFYAALNAFSPRFAEGWVLLGHGESGTGVVNLRGYAGPRLIFGGSTESSWFPGDNDHMRVVRSHSGYSIRVRGLVEYAAPDISDAEWLARPVRSRAGYFAVRAATGTGTPPQVLQDAFVHANQSGILKDQNLSVRPPEWKCFWVDPWEVRFTFTGPDRIHRFADFNRDKLFTDFIKSRG